MTCLNINREIDVYRRIAIAVGHYVSRANKGLSLAIIQGVTLRIVKKFYPKCRIRRGIQAALNVGVTATAYD